MPLLIPSILSLLIAFSTLPALAADLPNIYDASVSNAVYSQGSTEIPGLTWEGGSATRPSFSIEGTKNGKPAARVSGRFEGKNAGTLLFLSNVTQRAQFREDSSNFTVLIPLNSRKTPVEVKYIDDYGNLKSQTIQIVYENFYQFQLDRDISKKKINFDAGVSLSSLSYTQTSPTSQVKINQIGLTPKVGATYNLTSRLDVGASTFITAAGLPTSRNPDGIEIPRFYGVNLRVGYKLIDFTRGNLFLMTGPYFWGMILPKTASGITYGVVKLSGPQLFLVGRVLTPSGRTAIGYLKGAGILDADGNAFDNREIAIGGAYQLTSPRAKRRIMANLDLSTARFFVSGEKIQLNSFNLGVSTSF
jgi:hypothetical protein